MPQLYHNWGLRYQPAIESNAIAAIKNTAVKFNTSQYLSAPGDVQQAMHGALRKLEPSLYVTFPYFWMTELEVSDIVSSKQLQTAIQNEVRARPNSRRRPCRGGPLARPFAVFCPLAARQLGAQTRRGVLMQTAAP